MASVTDVNYTTAQTQQAKTQAASTGLAEDFAQFLTLLTTQLQNQDPLDPMDSTEFTNQLVAFTGVEQQINTNQKLDSLVSMALGNSFTASLNYVGMDVSYLSSEFNFDGTKAMDISYALDSVAAEAKISILDESGKVIYSEAATAGSTGPHKFTWDGTRTGGGKAPEGTYTVRVDALDSEGEAIGTSTVVTGRVHGIETQNGTLYVLVGERAVPVANILNAKKPETATDTTTDAIVDAAIDAATDEDDNATDETEGS